MTNLFQMTLVAVALAALTGSANAQTPAESPTTPPPPHERQAPAVERNLHVFDTLDFDVFSNQKWDRLGESHAKDIVVTWPDGHETKGIDRHIEDLKALFVFAPDITIKSPSRAVWLRHLDRRHRCDGRHVYAADAHP